MNLVNEDAFEWSVTPWRPAFDRHVYQAEVQLTTLTNGKHYSQIIEFGEGDVLHHTREELLLHMEEKILEGRRQILERIKGE